ncbi:Phenylalanine--tRNA ligase alpha subunit [Planctomycetes bacterium Pan216]|uniref:Phenylalanine--tRNA ligase alpha subunit n=1 Tax=Kolteria novifilia TaxID=2527975 RepID=A0A518AXK2_9BACT|nr:Phenylalanine--tRNA ligase alpha subunit [Planctomycetes bacterium Pan216]
MAEDDLTSSLKRLEEARSAALALIDSGDLEQAKSKYLGRKGEFRQLQQLLGKLPADQKPEYGKAFNQCHRAVEDAFKAAQAGQSAKKPKGPRFDLLPGARFPVGVRHPLIQTIEEISDIFGRMGFRLAEGPDVEDVFHNFVALNIPDDHPARDPRDNFYIDDSLMLRSQTSTVQIRVMEKQPPPVRIISIGRVYRPDTADATHSPMFHQVEGLYVAEEATMADLKTILRMFCQTYLGEHVDIRFRPSFFPFTEPSIEVDMRWSESEDRWIELGGAGMVDPNVFKAVGYDPEKVSGFAFGLGVERLAMRRHDVSDLRLFFENDVRFLRQFA